MDRTPRGNEVIDFDPLKLPPEIVQAVGRVMAAGAQTEEVLQAAVGGLAGIDALSAMAITTHLNMNNLFQIIKSLASLHIESAEQAQQLADLLSDIAKAQEARNNYAHCRIGMRSSGPVITKFVARTELSSSVNALNVEEMEREATELHEAGIALMQFLIAYDLLPPVPERKNPPTKLPSPREREGK